MEYNEKLDMDAGECPWIDSGMSRTYQKYRDIMKLRRGEEQTIQSYIEDFQIKERC